jgi:hypothetical protein
MRENEMEWNAKRRRVKHLDERRERWDERRGDKIRRIEMIVRKEIRCRGR